jgi:ATP-dependent Clp protease protease subunit
MQFTPKKKAEKKEEENEEEVIGEEISPEQLAAALGLDQPDEEMRVVGLYGDIDERKSRETLSGLLVLHHSGKSEDEEGKQTWEPMEMIISTYGGSADDMFALYDAMRMIQKDCEIHTFGLGKVMSAGVLLLAAGTKGKRKIGKNCRVMIHSVIGGNHGSIHNLENEMEEIRNSQDTYMEALVKETSLTKRTLKKLLERKVNVYLSASEAVEYGIADIIV